jgi:hypothetical protein
VKLTSRHAIVTVGALSAGLAACGGSSQTSPSSSASGSPSASSTSLFTSTDFTASIPSGWSDQTTNESAVTAVSVSGTVLMLLIAPPSFTDRVNEHIDVSIVQQTVPNDALSSYLETAAQHGATNLSPVEPFNLDHTAGLFITYDLTAGGAMNKAEDMVVNHNNNTYDIVLNTSAADFDQQLPALQQVLNTWKWTAQ